MKRRRTDVKARTVARAFLAGKLGASAASLCLGSYSYGVPELFSKDDKLLLTVIDSETDALPVGRLKENWHPDFLPAKLEQLAKYDAMIAPQVRDLCERLLATMKLRAVEGIVERNSEY